MEHQQLGHAMRERRSADAEDDAYDNGSKQMDDQTRSLAIQFRSGVWSTLLLYLDCSGCGGRERERPAKETVGTSALVPPPADCLLEFSAPVWPEKTCDAIHVRLHTNWMAASNGRDVRATPVPAPGAPVPPTAYGASTGTRSLVPRTCGCGGIRNFRAPPARLPSCDIKLPIGFFFTNNIPSISDNCTSPRTCQRLIIGSKRLPL